MEQQRGDEHSAAGSQPSTRKTGKWDPSISCLLCSCLYVFLPSAKDFPRALEEFDSAVQGYLSPCGLYAPVTSQL